MNAQMKSSKQSECIFITLHPQNTWMQLPDQMKHQNNLSECVFINAVGVLATQIELSQASLHQPLFTSYTILTPHSDS